MLNTFGNSKKDFLSRSIPAADLFSKKSPSQKKSTQKSYKGIDIKMFFAAAALAFSAAATSSQTLSFHGKSEVSNVLRKSETVVNSAPVVFKFESETEAPVESRSYLSADIQNFPKNLELKTRKSDISANTSIDFLSVSKSIFPKLQQATIEVLDADEIGRLEAFKNLERGWDFGSGETLNPISIKNFDRFFAVGGFKPANIATFMSSEGNLIASWPYKDGDAELEFAPSYFSYIDDSLDEARRIAVNRASELRNELAKKII